MKKPPKQFDLFICRLFTRQNDKFFINSDYIVEVRRGQSYPSHSPTIVFLCNSVSQFRKIYDEHICGSPLRYLSAETFDTGNHDMTSCFHIFVVENLFHSDVLSRYTIPIDVLQTYAESKGLCIQKFKRMKKNRGQDEKCSRFEILDFGD